jgi:hypothetical protein
MSEAKKDTKEVDVTSGSLTLPMPCHYLDKTEWKPGTVVHFVPTALGIMAIVKPKATNRFLTITIDKLSHGDKSPDAVEAPVAPKAVETVTHAPATHDWHPHTGPAPVPQASH